MISKNLLFLCILALDAYCLIEIFDFLRNRLQQLTPVYEISKALGKRHKHSATGNQNLTKKSSSDLTDGAAKSVARPVADIQTNEKNEEILKFEDPNYRINEIPISPQQLRLVCDNMLTGLGKELRRCGIDTVIIDNNRDHSEVAKVNTIFQLFSFNFLLF